MSDQKTEQKPEHEKRIREFLGERATMRGLCPEQIAGANDSRLNTSDLRALLADLDRLRANLDSMRGALKRIACIQNKMFGDDWEEIEDAREIARAALKGASHE